MNKQQLRKYLTVWQKDFDEIDEDEGPYEWRVFGTLTFGYFVGLPRSRRLLNRWLREIANPAYPQELNWFAVTELDRWKTDIRIHFLVGGSRINYQPRWIECWHKLSGGKATIFEYEPGAFAEHVISKVRADGNFKAVMDLFGWGLYEDQ